MGQASKKIASAVTRNSRTITAPQGRFIATCEPLEHRWLFSASVAASDAAAGIALHERAGVKFTADLGSFVDAAPGTGLEATISWGDGKSSTGIVKAEGVAGTDEIKFALDGTHTYSKSGTYAITATVLQPGPPGTNIIRLVASFSDRAIVASRLVTALNATLSGT